MGKFNKLAGATALVTALGGVANAGELENRQQALDESVKAFKTLVKPLEGEIGMKIEEVLKDADYCYMIDNEDTANQCSALAENVEMAALDLELAQEKMQLKTAETREVKIDETIEKVETREAEVDQDLEVANTVLAALRRVTE